MLRHPPLNSNNLYSVPPLHCTPGLTHLLLSSLASPPNVHPLPTCDLPGSSISARTTDFHLSVVAAEQSLETDKNSKYAQASSLPAWCVSQEYGQVCVPVATWENPHTSGSPPSFTPQRLCSISHNPAEMAKPVDFSAW